MRSIWGLGEFRLFNVLGCIFLMFQVNFRRFHLNCSSVRLKWVYILIYFISRIEDGKWTPLTWLTYCVSIKTGQTDSHFFRVAGLTIDHIENLITAMEEKQNQVSKGKETASQVSIHLDWYGGSGYAPLHFERKTGLKFLWHLRKMVKKYTWTPKFWA